jgi:hypothetical protein
MVIYSRIHASSEISLGQRCHLTRLATMRSFLFDIHIVNGLRLVKGKDSIYRSTMVSAAVAWLDWPLYLPASPTFVFSRYTTDGFVVPSSSLQLGAFSDEPSLDGNPTCVSCTCCSSSPVVQRIGCSESSTHYYCLPKHLPEASSRQPKRHHSGRRRSMWHARRFEAGCRRLFHHQPKDDSGHSQTRGSVHQLVTPVLDSRNASRMLRQCFVKQVSNINVFRHSWSAEPRAIALLCMTDSLQQPGPSSSKIPGNFRPLNRS